MQESPTGALQCVSNFAGDGDIGPALILLSDTVVEDLKTP